MTEDKKPNHALFVVILSVVLIGVALVVAGYLGGVLMHGYKAPQPQSWSATQ